jgi:hypothetical protein
MDQKPDRRFPMAMGAYIVLAAAAWSVLTDELLWTTWFALAAFAFKTWLVAVKRRLDSDDH